MGQRQILPVRRVKRNTLPGLTSIYSARQGLGQPNSSPIVLVDDVEAHESQCACGQN